MIPSVTTKAAEKKATEKKAPKKAKRKASPKKAPEAKALPKMVAGVKTDKVKEKQLDFSIERLELPKGGSIEDKIRRIAAFFDAHLKEVPAADVCDDCGGSFVIDISEPLMGEVCPWCGDGPAAPPAAKTNGASTAIVPADPEELAVAETVEVVDATEHDLDDSCKKVKALKKSLAKNFWMLGREISLIHERKLWRYRIVEATSEPMYSSFDQFVQAELGMVAKQARKYMDVYAAFNEDDVNQVGVSKLSFVLKLPPGPMRDKLLAAARNGASYRDLEREAKGDEDDDSDEDESLDSGPERITVALVMGDVRLPMWKRAGANSKAKPEPARSVKDDAFCEEQLPNGVRQIFRLVQKRNGQIELVIERVRDDG